VLLLSTYELGQQPLGLASPMAALALHGHETRGLDLSLESLEPSDLDAAEALVISVPMHTALRLALAVLDQVRRSHPDLPVAFHGLYATVAAPHLRAGELAVAGDADDSLLEWLMGLETGTRASTRAEVRVELGSARRPLDQLRPLPDRSRLPALERYAHLVTEEGDKVTGAVEATRGCSHRCRHCPVPTVYDGRTRAEPVESVLGDIAQLVDAGAGHIHFADPDFFNRPAHALRVARALHARFPDVSFDATIKVSHVLSHRDEIREIGELGCLFVVSAIESTSPVVLARLAKGHRPEEAGESIDVLRSAGIEPRPSFLPFTPWTTLGDVVDLLDFVAAYDLIESVDPVQYGIRLLLPPGSLLLAEPDAVLEAALRTDDTEHLGWTWSAAAPELDDLQRSIAARTEEGACSGEAYGDTYAAVRRLTWTQVGRPDPGLPVVVSRGAPGVRPHLSESWFCCAEPTSVQLGAVAGSVAR